MQPITVKIIAALLLLLSTTRFIFNEFIEDNISFYYFLQGIGLGILIANAIITKKWSYVLTVLVLGLLLVLMIIVPF